MPCVTDMTDSSKTKGRAAHSDDAEMQPKKRRKTEVSLV